MPTLSHTTTRTTTTATTATSRKKKSNKNFYVMSLSLICGTCPPPLHRPYTAQTTGAPRTSALNKTGDASCLKGDYRVRREREGGRRGCHLGGFEELVFALSFYAWFDLNSLLAHCTLRVLPPRNTLSLLSPPLSSSHTHTESRSLRTLNFCCKQHFRLRKAILRTERLASLWPLAAVAAATCHTTWQRCRHLLNTALVWFAALGPAGKWKRMQNVHHDVTGGHCSLLIFFFCCSLTFIAFQTVL